VLVPDADRPEGARPRRERRAGVLDLAGLARGDLAARPDVRAPPRDIGDDDLVGRLHRAAAEIRDLPRETRPLRVDPERIDPGLALEGSGRERSVVRGGERAEEGEGEPEERGREIGEPQHPG
jgi:hypothetical protein